MLKRLKQTWRQLKAQPSGSRFEKLYRLRQKSQRYRLHKAAYLCGGVLLIAAGVLSYPVPFIPSEVLILLGIGLLAQGSLLGARILDWIERRLRGPFRWVARLVKPWPRSVKVALATLWMALLSFAGYGVYRLIAAL